MLKSVLHEQLMQGICGDPEVKMNTPYTRSVVQF